MPAGRGSRNCSKGDGRIPPLRSAGRRRDLVERPPARLGADLRHRNGGDRHHDRDAAHDIAEPISAQKTDHRKRHRSPNPPRAAPLGAAARRRSRTNTPRWGSSPNPPRARSPAWGSSPDASRAQPPWGSSPAAAPVNPASVAAPIGLRARPALTPVAAPTPLSHPRPLRAAAPTRPPRAPAAPQILRAPRPSPGENDLGPVSVSVHPVISPYVGPSSNMKWP